MPDRFPVLPNRGVTDGTTFKGLPPDMAPLRAMRNYLPDTPVGNSQRGARRPVLAKLFERQLKNSPIQAVATITRATGQTGVKLGDCSSIGTITSIPSSALVGQFAALDDVPSLDWFYNLDVTGSGGPTTNAISSCALSPDKDFIVAASNYVAGGFTQFTLVRLDLSGNVVWGSGYSVASQHVAVNALCVTRLYTIAAIYNTNPADGSAKIVVFRNDTGAGVLEHDLFDWAREGVAVARWEDVSGQEFVYVAFHGSAAAGTYSGGLAVGTPTRAIKAGRWAMHFRSGIYKFRVDGDAYGGDVLTRVAWGTPLASTGPYYEAAHNSWRFSEQGPNRPHGCEFTGLAVGADGSVYFSKRNQGWGPNDGHPTFFPDGSFEDYATVGKISPEGVLQWVQDTDSIREAYDAVNYPGTYNDLTFPGDTSPDPSIHAIAVDPLGNLYAAGRRNAAAQSVFSFDTDGTPRWAANVMPALPTASVREGAIAFDNGDGTVLVAGDRNDDWDGASPGDNRHLWKLNGTTGAVVWSWDLNENVSALCVSVTGAGQTFYGSDKVT